MNQADIAWARADLYVTHELVEDNEWLARHGRKLRRKARESQADTLIDQRFSISARYRWWRRYGEPRGLPFVSPWMTRVVAPRRDWRAA